MKDIAEFRITGRIGKSSIMDKVAFLDIASNYRRKVNDEWEDDTHWNRVTLFGKNIDRAAELAVGSHALSRWTSAAISSGSRL